MAKTPSSSRKSASNSGETPAKNPAKEQLSQVVSILKAYLIPLTLFSLFFLFQLVLLPKSFPPSHYDVLQISRESSVEKVKEAYENFVSKWNSGTELPTTNDFIKIRYAYELLSNPSWKRDYDLFGIDEHQHVLKNITLLNSEERYSAVNLPLLDVGYSETHESGLSFLSSEDFRSIIENERSSLIQIYSDGSNLCKQFSSKWKKIATLLGEIANTGVVELGEFELVSSLAEKKPTGQPFFRNGLPSLIAIPRGCRASNCLVRYEGELSVDAVTDWFATTILMLPRIPYYTKDTLGPGFLAKSSYHKVKVLFFSDTGMCATPFVRELAKKYRDYASFACVLWREEENSYWWKNYYVETAPATVFLRDPGTKPLVYYGSVNSSWFVNVMEDNKLHELPQMRSVTSKELGCDARGYSRAKSSTDIWYCVILIGRPSSEMNEMRQGLHRVQQTLSEKNDQDVAGIDELASPSAKALEEKRLTFTWMDGEVQKNLCMFYIGGELGLESCGPRRSMEENPRMVMVRYLRNDSISDVSDKKASSSILDLLKEDVDPVSQLVARYDGSFETTEIIEWISKIVKDGDSANLPFYRTKTPELVPENSDPLWLGSGRFISTSERLKHKLQSIVLWFRDLRSDPKIGPLLLLGALMSFGGIWLRRSQPASSTDSDQPQQIHNKKDIPKEWRDRKRMNPTGGIPASMTDVDPKDAYQMPLSDSDDE